MSRRRAGKGTHGTLRRAGGREGRAADAAADELAAAVEALAVLLDAGIAPSSAWAHVGGSATAPLLVRRVAARVAAGAPPDEALGVEAPESDAAGRALAAAWAVAAAAGAPLAPALRGAARALRDRAEVIRELGIALSGPRSTARLVGWLPVVGVGFALLLGVDVAGVLTASAAGIVLLVSGAGLAVVGRAWSRRMVRTATPRGEVPGTAEELVAIALSSGLSIGGARRLVADVCGRLALQPPDDHALDAVLGLAERAGAPAVDLLAAAAVQRRRVARAEGRRAAAELGVRLLLPLAVCVLPSFLLLGVAPVVLGLISSTATGF